MRSARLSGLACSELGVIRTIAEEPAAIALSRGGAAKVYDYVDPNEDAVLFAIGEGGVLVAVADGHHGESGARILLEQLEAELAPGACAAEAPAQGPAGWSDWLYERIQRAASAIGRHTDAHQIQLAPTTLSLAVVRQREDSWAWACVGDSHAFRVDASGAHDVGSRSESSGRQYFLGKPEESWHREATRLGCEPLGETHAIVLATDGLSERGIGVDDPAAVVAQAVAEAAAVEPGRRSQWLARQLVECANASHRKKRSGDNIAIAVVGP